MPNAAIILTGLAANYPIPGTFVELDFAQGPVAGAGSLRKVIILGNQSTAGTATNDTVLYGPDTPVPCQNENDVIRLFGPGSQLHRAFIRFTAINKVSLLYFVAVAPSAGAAATGTITLTTTATANGNLRFWVNDQFVDTAITVGQTPTQIAAAAVLNINGQNRFPVTASSAAGVITITAVNLGPEGNWIKIMSAIQGTGVGTTTSLTANTFLSGGTTADNNTNALATIAQGAYYYIILCDSDAGNIGRAATQVNNNAAPTVGIRQRLVAASADVIANVITLATGINSARAEIGWNGATAVDLAPVELAASLCALYSLLEQGSPFGVFRKNFSNFPSQPNDPSYWPIIPGRAGVGGAPSTATVISALSNGITPLSVNAAGQAYLVKRITSRSLNGAVQDYRIRDAHKVTICDYWCDDAQALTQSQYGGRDLLPDPPVGAPAVPPTAVTPRMWGNDLKGLVTKYGFSGQWTNLPNATPQPGQTPADLINAAFVGPQIENNPPTRMSVAVPLAPVNIADQFAILALQVT